MKKILITGGAGFIGSNLAKSLISKGYKVTILDNLSQQIHGVEPERTSPLYNSIVGITEFIKAEVTDRIELEKALEDQDAVIHLAAETGTGQSMYEIDKYCKVNIGGTALLLDILTNKPNKVKKLIVASSRSIYGEGKYTCLIHGDVYPEARLDADMKAGDFNCKCPICSGAVELKPTSEDSKIHPSSIYGITKQNQEQMILTAGKSLGIPSVALRYQNVYGPGQSLTNPYTGILSIFSTQIRNGNDISIFEDGLESRDFVYIEDVVSATILALEKDAANYQVFNVGADYPVDVITVAKLLVNNYNSNVNINVTGNYRLGDIRHNYADLNKIKEYLGYEPMYDFKTGLKKFCAWVLEQEIAEDTYENSINEMKAKGLYK